jgi:hypothetical protein
VADARRGDVELAVAEARCRQEDAHTIERLALRLMDPASQEPNLESPSAREARVQRREWSEREMSARHGEGHTHGKLAARPIEGEEILLCVELDARDEDCVTVMLARARDGSHEKAVVDDALHQQPRSVAGRSVAGGRDGAPPREADRTAD